MKKNSYGEQSGTSSEDARFKSLVSEDDRSYYFRGAGPKRQERMDAGLLTRYPKLSDRPKKEKKDPVDRKSGVTPAAYLVRNALKGGHITAQEADFLNPKHSEPPVKRVRKKTPKSSGIAFTEEVRNGRTYKVTRLPDYTPAQLEAARKKADVRGTFRNRKEGKAGG
jgi:hypothetical protein